MEYDLWMDSLVWRCRRARQPSPLVSLVGRVLKVTRQVRLCLWFVAASLQLREEEEAASEPRIKA